MVNANMVQMAARSKANSMVSVNTAAKDNMINSMASDNTAADSNKINSTNFTVSVNT